MNHPSTSTLFTTVSQLHMPDDDCATLQAAIVFGATHYSLPLITHFIHVLRKHPTFFLNACKTELIPLPTPQPTPTTRPTLTPPKKNVRYLKLLIDKNHLSLQVELSVREFFFFFYSFLEVLCDNRAPFDQGMVATVTLARLPLAYFFFIYFLRSFALVGGCIKTRHLSSSPPPFFFSTFLNFSFRTMMIGRPAPGRRHHQYLNLVSDK